MAGMNILDGEDNEALIGLKGRAQFAGAKLEKNLVEVGRIAQVADWLGVGGGGSVAKLELEFFCYIIERLAIGLWNGGCHLVGDVVGVLADFFIQDDRDNRVANFFEALG